MTTQTPSPTDNDRLSRLEGGFEQMNERFSNLEREFGQFRGEVHNELGRLRSIIFTGFGVTWASMIGGFIAILTLNT